jgi:hypothetical protein
MKGMTLSLVLLGLVIAGRSAEAQTNAPASSLTRALATFATLDANHDGKLSAQELTAVPIERQEFLAHDHDKDGTWSKDEFLVYYRRRLLLAGQPVGADLETETARVQALRKTKAAEQAKTQSSASESAVKGSQSAEGTNVAVRAPVVAAAANSGGAPSPSVAAIETGLENALQKLEQRAAQGHATREDFQAVQDQMIARARAAANGAPSPDAPAAYGTEAYRKMLQSLERLEKRANEGFYSPAEYQEFRDMIIHRSRQIAKKELSAESGGAGGVSPEIAAIEKGLTNALDELEQRAAAGHATREDFQRVRDQMIARARAAASSSTPGDANAPGGSDAYQAMMKALERLEKRAAEGAYSHDEYEALRQQFIHRAREIQTAQNGAAQNAGATGAAGAASPSKAREPAAPNSSPPAQPVASSTAQPAPAPARDANANPAQPVPQPPPVQSAPVQPTRPAGEVKDAPKPQQRPPAPVESRAKSDAPAETRAKSDAPADTQRPPR